MTSRHENLESERRNLRAGNWDLKSGIRCCALVLAISAMTQVAYAEGTLRIVPLVRAEQVIVSIELDNGYTDEVRQVISGDIGPGDAPVADSAAPAGALCRFVTGGPGTLQLDLRLYSTQPDLRLTVEMPATAEFQIEGAADAR